MDKKCLICRKDPDPNCTWNQGRCPHRKPTINIQPKDTSRSHFYVSLVKSIIRIGAGGCLIQGNLMFAGGLLIFAEALGVLEELV